MRPKLYSLELRRKYVIFPVLGSYFLKVTCYSYKLLHEKCNLLHYLLHVFQK